MRLDTEQLHGAFLDALGDVVLSHGDVALKPLDIELAPPLPSLVRLYLYSLVVGGKQRPGEFKAVLRVPKHPVGEYRSFEYSEGRFVILAAYRPDLDVFVLWDASLHERFKNGGNIQVQEEMVLQAAGSGWAEQRRRMASGDVEVVVACRPSSLRRGLSGRLRWTGGELRG